LELQRYRGDRGRDHRHFLGLLAVRLIVKPIQKITESINLLATGDLDMKGQDQAYLQKFRNQGDELAACLKPLWAS
jgi:hypothetical protein